MAHTKDIQDLLLLQVCELVRVTAQAICPTKRSATENLETEIALLDAVAKECVTRRNGWAILLKRGHVRK
jgi:hypothetical protein